MNGTMRVSLSKQPEGFTNWISETEKVHEALCDLPEAFVPRGAESAFFPKGTGNNAHCIGEGGAAAARTPPLPALSSHQPCLQYLLLLGGWRKPWGLQEEEVCVVCKLQVKHPASGEQFYLLTSLGGCTSASPPFKP